MTISWRFERQPVAFDKITYAVHPGSGVQVFTLGRKNPALCSRFYGNRGNMVPSVRGYLKEREQDSTPTSITQTEQNDAFNRQQMGRTLRGVEYLQNDFSSSSFMRPERTLMVSPCLTISSNPWQPCACKRLSTGAKIVTDGSRIARLICLAALTVYNHPPPRCHRRSPRLSSVAESDRHVQDTLEIGPAKTR